MKKIILLIVLSSLLIASVCFAEYEYSLEQIAKNKITEVKIYLYPFGDQQIEISKEKALYKVISYDWRGLPTKMDQYQNISKFSGDITCDTTHYTYKQSVDLYSGVLEGITTFKNGKIQNEFVFEYNSEGELIQQDLYWTSGLGMSLQYSITYMYNDSPYSENEHLETGRWLSQDYNTHPANQVIEMTYEPSWGTRVSHTYQYNDEGHCIKEVNYNMETDSLYSTYIYTYNDDGYIINSKYLLPEEGPHGEINYRYNEMGQLIEKTDSRIISNEMITYAYDQDGLLKTELIYRLNGDPKYKFEYEYVR